MSTKPPAAGDLSAPDAALVQRIAQSRDRRALASLHERYEAMLNTLALNLVFDSAVAAHAVAAAYRHLWQHAGELDPTRGDVSAWLANVTQTYARALTASGRVPVFARWAMERWARLRDDYGGPLRRGAWYDVLNVSSKEVVVHVQWTPVAVPHDLVEMVSDPPDRWTVVEWLKDPPPRVPVELAERYAVCPTCHERVPVPDGHMVMGCRRCGGAYDVAWDEPDLRGFAVASVGR
jgi:hypothetical protein